MNKYLKIILKSPIYQKYEIFILPSITLIVSLILLILVIIPQFLKFFDNNKLLTDANQKIENLTKKANILSALDSSAYKDHISTSLVALPTDQDIPNALAQVIFLVTASNLQAEAVTVSNNAAGSASSSTPDSFLIRVEVNGDAANLKRFMDSLKTSPRVMKVDNIDISQESISGRVQASVTISIYYQALPTSLGDLSQPVPEISEKELSLLNQIKQNTQRTIISVPLSKKGKADPFN